MAYSLFTGSYGLSSANFRVRILEVGNATPALIALQDGTIVNSQGETTLDAYGNLSCYLDDSKTFGVHINQFLLESSDTAVAKLVRRTGFQIASAPSHADKELGPGALFYADTDPTILYHISTDGLHFTAVTGNGSPAGTDGLNNSGIFIYQRSNTGAPPLPNLSVIYTFATGAFTGLSNGWQASIPPGTDPVYVTSAVASARGPTDTIAPSEWATSVILSQNGISSGSIFLFQRTTTATPPPVPDAPVTYTFANGIATGLDNGWTQSLPTTGGSYRWMTTASALAPSGQSTDVINASEWAAVSLLAQDGTNGQVGLNNAIVYAYQRSATAPSLPTAVVTYTFTTGVAVGLDNGWTSTPPDGTDPIYVTVASASSVNPSDTIQPAEWAPPIVFAQNGTAGLNTSTIFLYKVTSTSTPPALPSAAATYTFSTATASGVNNGWVQSLPTSGGSYRWITTATALSTTDTDTILPSEWATASLLSQDGSAGLNNAIVYAYQRASSLPSVPSATVTYTFATGVTTGLNNGWTSTPPTGSSPLYVTIASASNAGSTDTIGTAEWASPVVLAQDGTAGLNTATIFLYKVTGTNSAPTLPSTTVTYTFATGVATGVNNGWTQSLPTSGGSYRWITTASALSNTSTDTINSSEWAPAALLAADGATGATGGTGAQGNPGADGLNNAVVMVYQRATSSPSVPSATVTYTFATASVTGLTNGWLATIPAGTDPIYVTSATAAASGTTDTIATGEWATPVVLAQNGTAALNAATVYLFQRTATSTAPSVPSATVTYTFATGLAAGVNNGWSQSLVPTGGIYRWMTTATALATGATDTIATGEWATVSLLAQDGAPGASMFTLVPNANMTVNGATVTKTAGGNTYNGQVYTSQSYSNGAQMTMAVNGTDNIVAGLNTDPLTSGGTGYAGIDYAVTVSSNIMQIYESGTYRGNFGAVSTGDVLGVRYDNANVYYTLNGTIVRTLAVGAGLKLALDASFGVLNASTSFTFAAAGAAGTNGVNGTNGSNGQRGSQTFYVTLGGVTATWSDSLANTASSGGGGPVLNDQVVESNSSVGFSQTRFWNGTSWVVVTQVLDGNLLVTGTVGAAAISVGSINTTKLAAGSVTASKLVLSDFQNLVFNGKGNSADGWTASNVAPTSITGAVFWPTGSVSSTALQFESRDNFYGTPFSILPTDQFYVAMDTLPFGGGVSAYTFAIGLVFTDANGGVVSYVAGATRNTVTSGFVSIAGSLTAVAGAAYATVWVQIAGPGGSQPFTANGAGHYATNVQVRRMNGGNLIVDGAISANKITANTITAAQISATAGITAGQIDARGLSIKDGSGNVILSAGVPLTSSNITPSAGWINTNVVAGSGNLYQNTDFSLFSSGIPTGFTVYNSTPISITNTVVSSGGAVGTAGYWHMVMNANATSNVGYFLSGGWAGWQQNVDYVWSFYARAPIGGNVTGAGMAPAWNHFPANFTWLQNPSLTTSWQRYVCQVNFGNNTLDANGFMYTALNPNSGVQLDFSCIQIETGLVPSGWAPLQYVDSTGTLRGNPSGAGGVAVNNSNISISSSGTLSGAGGGAVTIGGLGYTGALNASADISLVPRVYAAVAGNSISKTASGGSWDSDVYSKESFTGGAFASAVAPNTSTHTMFGLNTDPLTDSSFTSLDYAWYVQPGGGLVVYQSGAAVLSGLTYVAGDVFTITYDGLNVNYYQNGVLRYGPVLVGSGLKLYFDSSLYDVGLCLTNVRFGPMTNIAPTAGLIQADVATSLGFNPSFSAWAGALPDNWSQWGNSPPIKTVAYNTPGMQYGALYTISSADVTYGSVGMVNSWSNTGAPLSAGTTLTGSYSIQMLNGGTATPGYLIRLFTNSALTTYVDNLVPCPHPGTGGWQKVPWTATAGGAPIYNITIYQMAGWTGFPGGMTTAGMSMVFGPFTFNVDLPVSTAQAASGLINTSITIDGSGNLQGIGSGAGTQVSNSYTLLKASPSILSSTISINAVSGAGFVAGNLTWNGSGARTGGSGVALTPGGLLGTNSSGTTTFSIDASTGNAYFAGLLATGTASQGASSGSISSTATNGGGSSGINTGGLTVLTYVASGNDVLVMYNVNVVIMTNTNTPLQVQFNPMIAGAVYSPSGHLPEWEGALTQSTPMALAAGTGATAYNWGVTLNFCPSFVVPGATIGSGSKLIGFYVAATFRNGSGGGNVVTGSSIYAEGIATVREFKA
jgi:hypothetical protein